MSTNQAKPQAHHRPAERPHRRTRPRSRLTVHHKGNPMQTKMTRALLIVATLLLLPGCGSTSKSQSPSDSTELVGAPQSTDVTSSSNPAPEAVTSTANAATSLDGVDTCAALTAEEFTAATGITVTAVKDPSGACAYRDSKPQDVALLTVGSAQLGKALLSGMLSSPPPGSTYTAVPGVGNDAAVSGPPEGRAMVIDADLFFDLSRGFGATPLPADQLIALLKAVIG